MDKYRHQPAEIALGGYTVACTVFVPSTRMSTQVVVTMKPITKVCDVRQTRYLTSTPSHPYDQFHAAQTPDLVVQPIITLVRVSVSLAVTSPCYPPYLSHTTKIPHCEPYSKASCDFLSFVSHGV